MKFARKGGRPIIISGPCSAETREQTLATCKALGELGVVDILRAGIWKPRTSPDSFQGVGLDGLEWLAEARAMTGLPIAIEVATASHVEAALRFGVDVLWIGARTTVSPFAVQAIADALRGADVGVMIKNPMHPDLELWSGALERMSRAGIKNVALIHRGFSTSSAGIYRNDPLWSLAIDMKLRHKDVPMFCDPSHICGNRELIQGVAQRSADLNFDGLVLESHICPDKAWSDSRQQLTPDSLKALLDSIVWRNETCGDDPQIQLQDLRLRIDELDNELFNTLSLRMKVSEQIGELKALNGVTILQAQRWDDIMHRVMSDADRLGLSEEFLVKVLDAIHIESIAHQNKVMNR